MESEHYFDFAATSLPDKQIWGDALNVALDAWGNPSSIYKLGTKAKSIITNARERCAKSLGVKPENIFFTSGGTESDQIPILSILNRPEKGTVLVSSIEHPAIREQAEALKHCGICVKQIPSNKDGIIEVSEVKRMLTSDTLLVAIMAVNNETGAIQPIKEISDALTEESKGKRRPKFHVDCVQALGKIPLDISYKGIDSAAFSAHKIAGPRGIGILYLATPNTIEPFLRGGGQENNIRSGTENVFGIEAFSHCIEKYRIANENKMGERFENQKVFTANFIAKLKTIKNCTILPHSRDGSKENEEHFSPWILQASFKKIPGQVMVRALDSKGFYISTGSACSAKKQSRPILAAMQVSPDEQETAVRFSFGSFTTEKAMNELFEEVKSICNDFM